ncbi:MAG: 2-phospho-L-lactate guanylyltransferase [Rhodobacteraceae bacterium]|nr:2-phospho-L-lactate guanylyltransferase [Paracoccaceae bacterium]
MKDLLFIVPMKDPKLAKSRLSEVLPDAVRARLALALYQRMLGFLAEAQPDVDVLVVSESETIAAEARLFLQQQSNGLNAAVGEGAAWAKAQGYAAICVLPADLADPSAEDLARLLALRGGVVLAPAHDGGTNALLVSPPDAIEFCYGKGSCKAHQNAAAAAGVPCTIVPLESFKYDIDTSADLARVRGVEWA